MKFYVTRYRDNATGVKRLKWQGTQDDAKQARKVLSASPENSGVETLEFDVPTDKPGLLAFLNEYVTGELKAEQIEEMFRQKFSPQQVSKL